MTRLTSLEDALYADRDGVWRDEAIACLRSAERDSCVACTAEERQAAREYAAACSAAIQVIETLWTRYHGVHH